MTGNDIVAEWLRNMRPGGETKTLATIVDEAFNEVRMHRLGEFKKACVDRDQARIALNDTLDALNDLLDWLEKDTEGRFNSITTPGEIVQALTITAKYA